MKAQFFSGGVDSYFTLTRAADPPGVLLFIRGYDMKVEDETRWKAFMPGEEEDESAKDMVLNEALHIISDLIDLQQMGSSKNMLAPNLSANHE